MQVGRSPSIFIQASWSLEKNQGGRKELVMIAGVMSNDDALFH